MGGVFALGPDKKEHIVRINQDVLDVLARCSVNGTHLALPPQQLDRRLYEYTATALRTAGGQWRTRAQAFVFPEDPTEILETMLITGQVHTQAQTFGYFPTPPPVVARMIDLACLADVPAGSRALEPSAGQGALARPLADRGLLVDCVELQEKNAAVLRESGFASVSVGDFLTRPVEPLYVRILMNPPFAKQSDIEHVRRAHAALAPGGLLVAVMSNGTTFRPFNPARGFRELVQEHGGRFHPLPENSFTISGTNVHCVLLTLPAC